MTIRLLATPLIAVMVLVVTGFAPGSRGAAAASCPPPPAPRTMDNPAYYTYVQTYDPACASHQNWTRSFNDVTRSTLVDGSNRLAVTASTALGGAIASLRVNDREFIASGGHGSALQWAFHAWKDGSGATECYNPTQAGSRPDDQGPPPFHGPSTSALYTLAPTGTASLQTGSRPAMYVPLSMTEPGFGGCRSADYQPNRSPYTYGLSPYWLDTTIQLAPDHGLAGLSNVIRVKAQLGSEDDVYPNFDGVLVAYLQRDFVQSFAYDPATGTLTERQPGAPGTLQPVLRCTADHAYCLGVYFSRSAMPGAYYYTATSGPDPYNGMSGVYLSQVTAAAHNVGSAGTRQLNYDVELAVGNLPRVTATMNELARQLG